MSLRGSETKVTAPVNLIPSELHKFHKGGDARPFLADVDIVCNGGYIPVHSAVLMAGCPMLQQIFASERGTHNDPITIHLLDYSIDDVTAVVVLFYTGCCVVQSRDQMEQVYEILDHLGIRECTTPSLASTEETKKKTFIRRYLVCEDDDDDDMLIEDGEIIPVDDPDGEADDTPPKVKQPVPPGPPPSVTRERMDVENKDAQDKIIRKPDRIESEGTLRKTDEGKLEERVSERKKPEEHAKPHTSTAPKVPKVNRDGVTGVKTPDVENKNKHSSESESESSDDGIKDSKSGKSKKLSTAKETTTKRKASRESHKVSPKRRKRSKAIEEDDESEFEADSQEEDDDDDEVASESEVESISSKSSTIQQKDVSEDDSSPVRLRKSLRSRSRPKAKEDSPVFKRLRRREWKKIKYDDDDDDDDDDNDDNEDVQNNDSSKGQVVQENNRTESTSRRSKSGGTTEIPSKSAPRSSKSTKGDTTEIPSKSAPRSSKSTKGDTTEIPSKSAPRSSKSTKGDTTESLNRSASRSSKSTRGDTKESPSKHDKKSKSIPSKVKSSDTSKGRRRKGTNDEEHPSDEVDVDECVSLQGLTVLLTRLSSEEIMEKTRRKSTSSSSSATVRSVSIERELENGPNMNSSNTDASNVDVNEQQVPHTSQVQQVPHTRQVQRPSSPTPKSLNGSTSEPPPEVVSIPTTSESTAVASTSSASRASVDSDISRPTVELTMDRMQKNIRKWRDCVLKCDACPTSHASCSDCAQCLERRGSYRCWLCLGIFVTSVTTYEDHCVDVHVYGKPGLGRCPICHVYIDVNSARTHILQTHLAPEMSEQLQETAVSADESINESQENSQAGLIRIVSLNKITEPEDEEQTEEYNESGPQSGSTDQLYSSLPVTLAQSRSHLSGASLTSSLQDTAQSQVGLMTGSQIGIERLRENVSAVVISHGEEGRNEMGRDQIRRPSLHGQVTVANTSVPSSNSTATAPSLGQGQTVRSAQSARPMTTTSASVSNGTSRAGQIYEASRAQTPAPVSHYATAGQTHAVSRAQTPAPVSHYATAGQTHAVSRAQTPAPVSHYATGGQTHGVSRAQTPAPVSHYATGGQTHAVSRAQTPAPVSHYATGGQTQAVSRAQTPSTVSHYVTAGQTHAVSRAQTPAPVSHSTTTNVVNEEEEATKIANKIKDKLKSRQQSTNRPTLNNTAFSQPQTAVRHSSTPQGGHLRAIPQPTPTSTLAFNDARMPTMTTTAGLSNNKFTLSSGANPRPMPPQTSASSQALVSYPSRHEERIPSTSHPPMPSTSREQSVKSPGGLSTQQLQGPSGTPANNSPGFLAEIGGVPFRIFKRPNQTDPHAPTDLTTFGEQNQPNSYNQSNMRPIENFQSTINQVEPAAMHQGQLSLIQGNSTEVHPENRPASVMPPPPPAHMSSGMLVSQPQQSALHIASSSRASAQGTVGSMSSSGVYRCGKCAIPYRSQAHLDSHICMED